MIVRKQTDLCEFVPHLLKLATAPCGGGGLFSFVWCVLFLFVCFSFFNYFSFLFSFQNSAGCQSRAGLPRRFAPSTGRRLSAWPGSFSLGQAPRLPWQRRRAHGDGVTERPRRRAPWAGQAPRPPAAAGRPCPCPCHCPYPCPFPAIGSGRRCLPGPCFSLSSRVGPRGSCVSCWGVAGAVGQMQDTQIS